MVSQVDVRITLLFKKLALVYIYLLFEETRWSCSGRVERIRSKEIYVVRPKDASSSFGSVSIRGIGVQLWYIYIAMRSRREADRLVVVSGGCR